VLGLILSLAAAGNATLLALAIAWRAKAKAAKTGWLAAALLLTAAAAIALIALEHAGFVESRTLAWTLEGALTLASGPFLLLFVANLVGRRFSAPLGYGLFAPLALYCGFALLAPGWLANPLAVDRLIFVQMSFTAATAWLALSQRPRGRRDAQARTLALAAVAAVAALHFAQIARSLWPQVAQIRDVVPITGALALVCATAAIYFGSRISIIDSLIEGAPAADQDAIALSQALETALDDGLLRDPALTVAAAAAKLGAPPERLSKAIASVHGMTFPERLQVKRVDLAKRLLADPAEARTSMEAIGVLVGFGSRSAFYKAFGDRVGMSPAAFRAQNNVQTTKNGH
jgi:AraC-like DNA-binding protein